MLYLEDDDVAAIKGGELSIHRLKRGDISDTGVREMITLKMELEQIMKGEKLTISVICIINIMITILLAKNYNENNNKIIMKIIYVSVYSYFPNSDKVYMKQ